MDAHLFRVFALSLSPLLTGARIEKIQEPEPGILTITFYGGGKKRQLWIKFGRKEPFCFLADTRAGAGRPPSAPVMRIRRYFADRRVASVVCQFFSRRIWLLASTGSDNGDKAVWLCLDLAKGHSLHFLDASSYPEPEAPEWPEPAALSSALEEWRKWPVLTPALRRSLSHMDEPDQWALMEDLRAGLGDVFLYSQMENGERRVRRVSAWPLPADLAAGLHEEQRDDTLQAICEAGNALVRAAVCEKRDENLLAPVRRRVKGIRKLLDKLDMEENRLRRMRERETEAMALAENIWRLDRDSRADTLALPVSGEEAEILVHLDKRLTLRENMEKLFHAARRGKRGLAMLEERRAELLLELAALQFERQPNAQNNGDAHSEKHAPSQKREASEIGRTAFALRKTLPRNVALYVSSDGYLILRGKDAKGNHAMRKFAAPHDLWAHVESGTGAHVIIRRALPGRSIPEKTLDEAGGLAASKSWMCGAATARVMYAEVRHVKPARNGPAGKVLVDRIFAVRDVPVSNALEEKIVDG